MSYDGTYDPNDPNDPHAVMMRPSLKGLRTKGSPGQKAAEIRRLTTELASAQKHFDAVLNERVILSAGIQQALNIIDSNDPKVRNRVRMVLAGATDEVERLGREYRGEPEPEGTDRG